MDREDELQASFEKMAMAIKDFSQEEEDAVWRFMEAVDDAQLTEQDWLNLYGHKLPRKYKGEFTSNKS